MTCDAPSGALTPHLRGPPSRIDSSRGQISASFGAVAAPRVEPMSEEPAVRRGGPSGRSGRRPRRPPRRVPGRPAEIRRPPVSGGRAGAAPRPGPRDHLPGGPAGQRPPRRHRRGHPRPPGRRRRGGDRVGQDHPAAQDLSRAGPWNRRDDRAYAAPPDRRPGRRRTRRRGARRRAGRRGRLPGAVRRPLVARHAGQGHDRRHPAGRAPARPRPEALRHDHHRRGPRAEPQRRLPPGVPQTPPAPPPGPQGDHHLGDHRPAAVRRPLRGTGTTGAGRRGVGPHLPGGGALPPAGA